ncbi:HD-GYP domain-containing protein [Bradyrhizobium cenepequi]|uniref:HD-GYP domain-containing protein n=1 Tax=Bradyrhizobium cenepequi TaxID=2821403 RepID=UPI001CE395AE|nr:HD domain-containing phosphohydrolase [Bradyrhizobium cenepequi]MCA6110757.1 HD domain-containing protein [Bradyrhizobium cenepequi]
METVRRHHGGTYRHSLLVTGFAVAFAQKLKMRSKDQRRIAHAALLHDVGKSFIPPDTLDKPGKLTDDEMEQIKKHPRYGYDLLTQQGGFPAEILDCVLHHHELLDGSGYPDQLRAAQIADLVRVITIADFFCTGGRSAVPPVAAANEGAQHHAGHGKQARR